MSWLIFVKNRGQLQFIRQKIPYRPASEILYLTVDPQVWYDLASDSKAVLWAGDFIGGDDWEKIEAEALSLRDGWYRPVEQSLVYEGINLAELIRLEHTCFFRQAVRTQMILERVFNEYGVSNVILVGRSETPCRDRNRANNKNGVFEGMLLWEACKRRIRTQILPYEETASVKRSTSSGVGDDAGRVFAFDCWRDNGSLKLIGVGLGFHLMVLEPFVQAWNNQPGCEGLLLNLGKSIKRKNERAGFQLPEDTRFASLADVSTYNQNVEYVQTQRRLLDAFDQWKVFREEMDDTHILKNPHLDFHWASIWNSFVQLPLAVQKAFEALRIMNPDVVLTDEMASSNIRVFIEVAKKKGIFTVDCPHGYVGDIEEFQPHSDLYLAWGQQTIRQLTQRFKIDNTPIVATGSPVNEKVIKSESHTEKRQLYEKTGLSPNKKTVCVVTRSISANVWPVSMKEFSAGCDQITSLALNQDVQIIIKVSPRVDHVELYKRIFGSYKNIYVCTEHSLNELLPVIDVGIMFFYVGTASLLFLHKGIPTIFIRNKNTVGSTDIAWEIFDDTRPLSELCNTYLYDSKARQQRLMLQKQFAEQHLYIDGSDATQRAACTIKGMLESTLKRVNPNKQPKEILAQTPQSRAGQIGCLAVFTPQVGAVSETFITRQIDNLAPGRTVLVTREICEGARVAQPCLVTPHSGGVTVYYSEVEEQVVRFLAEHKVTHILCEYGCHGQSIVELNRRRLHLPIFIHFHGWDASKLLRDPEMVMYYKWMGKHVTGVIAVSTIMAARLAAIGIPAGKIKVIPYGVEVPPSICAVPEKQPCRFVSVTRMVLKKAPLLLLQAFKKVHEHIGDCTLDVIGDGTLFAEAKRFVDTNRLGNSVILHGVRSNEEVMKYMYASCVYVQHSITDPETGDAEGLPNSILEASLAGLPVVSTLHEGIPDEVEHGETGFLVKEGDVDGMADYMLKLAQNPHMCKTMGIAAHKKVAAEFSLSLWMQRLRDFLTSSDVEGRNQKKSPERSIQLDELSKELAAKKWDEKLPLYRKFFDYADYLRIVAVPSFSVVVVSWRLHPDTIKSFESLIQQRNENFQLVFVDNGARPGEFDCLKPFIDTYVRLNQNTGAYLARNVGAAFAKGRIILFLDDDGIPETDILRSYREAFDKYEAVAVRGSIWPKNRNAPPYTGHENYGPRPFPYFSCQEGNSAYRASVFYHVGGWDDQIIRGGGGLDLSLRLLKVEPDMRKQIYSPEPKLCHEQVTDEKAYKDKVDVLDTSIDRLKQKHPDFGVFQDCYKNYLQREDLLICRNDFSDNNFTGRDEHLYPQVLFRYLIEICKLDPTDRNTAFNIYELYKRINLAEDGKNLLLAYLKCIPSAVKVIEEPKLLSTPDEQQTSVDESLADSELNTVIPPQIKDGEFYFIIQKFAKKADVKTILEIGSSSGDGSTEAIVTGMRQNPNRPALYCMEVAKLRFAELQKRYADNLNVKPYNASSIPLEKFPTEQEVCSFYSSTRTSLNDYPIERILGWLRQDVEYVKKAGVPDGGIGIIKRDSNIKNFDMILIDGSEFAGSAELDELYGAKYVLLDDINAFKNYNNFKRLMADPDYSLVVENRTARNGFAVFRRDAGTAALTDRYTDSARELAKASTGKRIDTTVAPEPGGQQGHRLRFSVGMIAFNAELFLQTCLESIYDFAHEILIVEGSCPQALWDANSEGTSRDNTLKVIENFPDPDNKIKLVASHRWGHKDEMVNAYIPYVTGDYLFQVDSDEIWTRDMLQRVQQVLVADPSITCLEFNPLHFWHNFETVLVEGHWESPFMRIFRFEPGARWKSHEPPILLNPWGQAYNNIKKINATEKFGITFFHYSYLTEQQARWKGEFFKRYYDLSKVPSSDHSTRVGMTRDWFEKVWLAWRTDPAGVEAKYGTTPGGGPAWRPLGRTKPFYGQHPRAVLNHPLWSQAKYHRCGWERKGLIETVHNKPKAPSARPPDAAMSRKKNALVSYITAPLRMGPNYHPFKFSNPGIARSMVKVLTRMGYVVDVIDFNCKNFKSDKVYDLFIGHAGVNWEYLSRNVVADAVKIYFSTGTYWKQHNRSEAQRFDNFQRRHGVRLPFDRWIKVSEEFACHDADGIICLGNKNAVKSYAAFPVCFNLNNGVYSDDRYDRTKKDFESGQRHFLYFGSAGNIHKGLDLLVEAFMQLDAHLWCTGKVDSAFYRVYADELVRHPNIHFVNDNKSVALRSPLFYELMDKCNCVILPSCAEGSPGGVIECMNQGLIPIVSRAANVDVADFGIMLERDCVDQIIHVVREVMAKPAQWHRQRSIATRQTVLRDFSEEAFCRNLQGAVEGVVRQTPQVRIMREKVASQAQDNPTQYLNKYADNLGALLRGAAHLKSRNRHDEAAQFLQRAVIVDPLCTTAICRLGLYYAKRAQMTRAEKLVERALELCPGDKRCLAILQKIRQTPMSVPKHGTVNSYANEFVTNQQIRSGVDADITGSHINTLGNVVDG